MALKYFILAIVCLPLIVFFFDSPFDQKTRGVPIMPNGYIMIDQEDSEEDILNKFSKAYVGKPYTDVEKYFSAEDLSINFLSNSKMILNFTYRIDKSFPFRHFRIVVVISVENRIIQSIDEVKKIFFSV